MPSGHAIIPGGFSEAPTSVQQSRFRAHLDFLTDFITNTYIPDVEAVADVYDDYFGIGTGCRNLMAFGAFRMDDRGTQKLFPAGYVDGDQIVTQAGFEQKITESVRYSWYENQTGNLNPLQGLTQPAYPKSAAYSWLKAPRLSGQPFEAGPLARMWVSGGYRAGISVMDRHLARAREALKIAEAMHGWLNSLQIGDNVYDATYDQCSGSGQGLDEAPRGALGHWVDIVNGKIARYQIITPTCWNASPRDDNDIPGPMEQALIGTPVRDPNQPIEALRVIHSFDPCLSCAVHVIKPNGKAADFLITGGALKVWGYSQPGSR
jgi:hydrogenase large subunit